MSDRDILKTIYGWCIGNIESKSQIAPFCIQVRDLIDREVQPFEECLYTFAEMKETKQWFIERENQLKQSVIDIEAERDALKELNGELVDLLKDMTRLYIEEATMNDIEFDQSTQIEVCSVKAALKKAREVMK